MKKTFSELYNVEKQKPTAAQAFISKVAKALHKNEFTVRLWIAGRQAPCYAEAKEIAKMFRTTPSALFPNAKYAKDGNN